MRQRLFRDGDYLKNNILDKLVNISKNKNYAKVFNDCKGARYF